MNESEQPEQPEQPKEPAGEMSQMEYLRATFFTADSELTSTPVDDVAAIRAFLEAMEHAPLNAKRAALRYLADRWLSNRKE